MKPMLVPVVLLAGLASAAVFALPRESAELTKSQKQDAVEALAKAMRAGAADPGPIRQDQAAGGGGAGD